MRGRCFSLSLRRNCSKVAPAKYKYRSMHYSCLQRLKVFRCFSCLLLAAWANKSKSTPKSMVVRRCTKNGEGVILRKKESGNCNLEMMPISAKSLSSLHYPTVQHSFEERKTHRIAGRGRKKMTTTNVVTVSHTSYKVLHIAWEFVQGDHLCHCIHCTRSMPA